MFENVMVMHVKICWENVVKCEVFILSSSDPDTVTRMPWPGYRAGPGQRGCRPGGIVAAPVMI